MSTSNNNSEHRMTKEQNILFAKRNLVDSIWKSVNLEGFNVTFPETYAIVEQATLKNADMDAVIAANNLKLAWRYVLENIDSPLDAAYLKALHSEVARGIALEWGKLRTDAVGVGGTSYIPPVSTEEALGEGLASMARIGHPVERAMELCAYLIKGQFFWDCNKRTAMLASNKVLIENGCGLLSIPIQQIEDFHEKLHAYYEHDEKEAFKCYLKEHCFLQPEINDRDYRLQ